MKKTIKLLGIIALVAVIGFSMTACDNGGDGGGGTETLTYKGKGETSGDTYTLTVKKTAARAFTPIKGDEFELTDGTDKSKGTVDSFTGGSNFTLKPSNAGAPTFGATISGNDLTGLSGTITLTDGTPVTVTEALTPVTPPSSGSGGTLTVTDIPSEYNGKYATFTGYNDDAGIVVFGWQSQNAQTTTTVKISNGSVSLPMWTANDNNPQLVRYSGNNTVGGGLSICATATVKPGSNSIGICSWNSITFSNGSATVTWSSGTFRN